jgi:1-acyl-sn-glycerol-3-phosphate acyltransferase
MLFPEGRLTSGDSILDFKKGVVRLHQLTGAPILPVAIRYDSNKLIFNNVHIAIGKPFMISEELLENNTQDKFQNSRNYVREKVSILYEKLTAVKI